MTITDRIALGALAVALVAVGLGAWLILSSGTPQPVPGEVLDPFGSCDEADERYRARPGLLHAPTACR